MSPSLKPAEGRMRPEVAFLLLAGFFGSLFLIITPPFHVPDEPAHFFRAYQLSEGNLLGDRLDPCVNPCSGGWIPSNLLSTAGEFTGMAFRPDVKQHPGKTWHHLRTQRIDPDERSFARFNHAVTYAPTVYWAQTSCILWGRIVGLPTLGLLYFARVGNWLVWMALVYSAIRLVPVQKWLMVLLALTPMSLFIAASASADTFVNGTAYLLFALILYIRSADGVSMTRGYVAVLTLICAALAVSKLVYAPLIGLVLLVPARKFPGMKSLLIVKAGIPLLGLGLLLSWNALVSPGYSPMFDYVDPTGQLNSVLANPLTFAGTLLHTIGVSWQTYLREFVGVLGWLDTPLPEWLFLSYCIVPFLFVFHTEGEGDVSLGALEKLYILAIAIGTFALILLGVYLTWTRVSGEVILGAQGRYFIPIVPLVGMALYNRLHTQTRHAKWIGVTYSIIALSTTVVVLIHRYYAL